MSRSGAHRRLPYSCQDISTADVRGVVRALRSEWITQGPTIEAFERDFAHAVGARFAVAVSSGTAALHAACHAAGFGPGDEVVVPPLTFVATSNAVLYVGARPVFADVDGETGTLDPGSFERVLTRRTRGVIPVDYAGHPCDLEAIGRICRRRGIVVIEDAAHSLGAEYRGRRVGSQADLTVFSFHPVKHITTGEGGMITTNREDLVRRLRLFRSHGITKDPGELEREEGPWYYEMQVLGFNYRITDFQCALGRSQLTRLDVFLRRRRAIANAYGEELASVPGVAVPVVRPWAGHAFHLYPIRLELKGIGGRRRRIFEALRAAGLGVQVHYIPVHLQPYYRRTLGTRAGMCPKAETFYASEISLPIFPRMRRRDVQRVASVLRAALGTGA